jgi:hypothetical protein
VDVLGARKIFWIDLGEGTEEYQLPIRVLLSDGGQKVPIQPLIKHAEETDARVWNPILICWIGKMSPSAREVLPVDAAGEQVNILVLLAFGFVEARAPSEYNISTGKQGGFHSNQVWGRSLEIR